MSTNDFININLNLFLTSLIKKEDDQFNQIISKLLELMINLTKYAAEEVIKLN